METVLPLLLLRFAVIVGALVLLALLVFAVAVYLKRRGKLGDARRRAAPVVRGAARMLDERSGRGGSPAGTAMRAAGRYLDDRKGDTQGRRDAQ